MHKTPSFRTSFDNRCEIMGRGWHFFRKKQGKDWEQLYTDLEEGCSLSFVLWRGLATPNDVSVELIDETWVKFCVACGVDPMDEFGTLNDVFDEMRKIQAEIEQTRDGV